MPLVYSIIIPTFNRPRQLSACLDALAELQYPHDLFEVIVVNDGGAPPAATRTQSSREHLQLVMLTQPHSGPARARNTGASQARGRFLVFTDDDCLPAPDFLQKLEERLAVVPDSLVGGRTVNALPQNPFSTASQMLIHYLYTYYNRAPGRARFFASNNIALSAERFRAIGGFDTRYIGATAEDREFCDRWLHHGYQMDYDPAVLVYHAHRLDLRGFWCQHFAYGRGAHDFRRARARRIKTALRLEPVGFYLQLLRYPSRQVFGPNGVILAALLTLSQVANGAGFLWQWLQSRSSSSTSTSHLGGIYNRDEHGT